MPPKPITRLDARPDDAEQIAKTQKLRQEEEKRFAAIEQKKWEKENTPEKIAKRKAKEKAKTEAMWKKWDEEDKARFINKPYGPFNYYDKVVVSNPIKCGGCGTHEKYANKIGFVELQNACRCMHEVSKNCYYVILDGIKDHHHFEECEIEKVDKSGKKFCKQCISERGPLPAYDGLCECDELNK